ncbi:MAG: DoxX family membrane protein [Ignavibacteriae bacterium]|nr:DoxX family membrane protein [Ignavibacteriota bacterium]
MKYSIIQTAVLLILRLVLGYHFLYEGIDKLLNETWTSAPFLLQANWIYTDFFHSLANNQTYLRITDLLNIWGQILIGISLIIGLYSKVAAYFGAFLLFMYYITVPPFLNNQMLIDKNVIEFLCFLVIAIFPTSQIFGIDFLLKKTK